MLYGTSPVKDAYWVIAKEPPRDHFTKEKPSDILVREVLQDAVLRDVVNSSACRKLDTYETDRK